MRIDNFNITSLWSYKKNVFLEDKTGQKFTYINKNDMRLKALGLATSTPVTHLALSVANIAIRSLRILSFYHFWKAQDGSYSLKPRLFDTGKDALTIMIQPIALLALEASALYGLVSPYDGMKLYNNLELATYDRLIMMKLFKIGSIKEENKPISSPPPQVSDHSLEEPGSHENPSPPPTSAKDKSPLDTKKETPKEIPSIEEDIDLLIESFNKAQIPRQPKLIESFIKRLADHVLEIIPYSNVNEVIEKNLESFRKKTKKKLKAALIPTTESIAQATIKKAIEDNAFDKIEILGKLDLFGTELSNILTDVIVAFGKKTDRTGFNLPHFTAEEPETVTTFIEQYEKFLKIKESLPEAIQENIYLTPIDVTIQNTFVDYFEHTLTNLGEYILKTQEWDNVQRMNQLFTLIDNEDIVDQMKTKMVLKPLPQKTLLNLVSSFIAPASYKAIAQAKLSAIASNINEDLILKNFVLLIDKVKETLYRKDLNTKNDLYLYYFLMFLKTEIEKSAIKIKPLLDSANFDFNDEEQRKLALGLQAAIQYLQETLNMDLDFKVEMSTQNDALIMRLVAALDADNNDSIKEWIASIENNPHFNLEGFQYWLTFARTVQIQSLQPQQNPAAIYALYVADLD